MKRILALLLVVVMTCSLYVTAFANELTDVRWDSKEENLNACAGVRFTMVDGIALYKFSLYKDGQLVDASLHEIGSTDNQALIGFEEEIEALGEGSYTVTVGTVAGEYDDYDEYENRADIPVLASKTTPTAFVYKEPFHVLPKPTGITVDGNTLTVSYSGPECVIKASLYADFGDGKFVHVSSGSGNDETFSIEYWYKNFYNYMDRMIKRDPVKYSEDRAKMLFKAQAFPKNILTYKKSGEYTITMDAPKRAEEEKPVVEPVTPEAKPELLLPGANAPEVDEFGYYNPFNNSLFSVVSEFDVPKEIAFPIYQFETIENDFMFVESGGTYKMLYTPIYFKVNYDGTTEFKLLAGGATEDEAKAQILYDQALKNAKKEFSFYESPGVYNDGIALDTSGEFEALVDVEGNQKFVNVNFSGFSYDYNLGLFHSIDAPAGFMNLNYEEYFTTFEKIMTDGSEMRFKYYITGFDDNGYAILHTGSGEEAKHYVIKLKQGIIPTVTYNGKKILFDQIPVIESGRTLVPLRAIFEAVGAQVSWDGATRTVTAVKDGISVSLTIDSVTASKNGEVIKLDVPAKIINGRTMVPVRFIADSFGVNVNWDATLSQVVLTAN